MKYLLLIIRGFLIKSLPLNVFGSERYGYVSESVGVPSCLTAPDYHPSSFTIKAYWHYKVIKKN